MDHYLGGRTALSEEEQEHAVFYSAQASVKTWYFEKLEEKVSQAKQKAFDSQEGQRNELQRIRAEIIERHNQKQDSLVKLSAKGGTPTHHDKYHDLFIFPNYEQYSERIRILSETYRTWSKEDLLSNVGRFEGHRRLLYVKEASRYRFEDGIDPSETDIPVAMYAELSRRGVSAGKWHTPQTIASLPPEALKFQTFDDVCVPAREVDPREAPIWCSECSCAVDAKSRCKYCGKRSPCRPPCVLATIKLSLIHI